MKMFKDIRVLAICIAMGAVFNTVSLADELVVSESGNVGIGVTDPTARLTIDGGGMCLYRNYGIGFAGAEPYAGDVTGDRARIYYDSAFLDTDGDFLVFEKTDANSADPDGGVAFVNKGSDNVRDVSLIIRGSGNVGIGVEVPEHKLHLKNGRVYFDAGFGGNTVNYNGTARTYRYALEGNTYNLLLRSLGNYTILGADRTNGTLSAPSPVVDGETIFQLRTSGTNANLTQNAMVAISVLADGNPVGDDVYQKLSLMGNRLVIRTSGNVGIGTTNPQDKLDVNGYVRANGTRLTSDALWKENVETIEYSLERVSQLRGVSYDWIDKSRGEDRQIGVIAQEVEKVFPEVVHTDDQGYKSVEYAKLVAPLIEAVKALKAENQRLAARIEALEKNAK